MPIRVSMRMDDASGPAGLLWFGRATLSENLVELHLPAVFSRCKARGTDPFQTLIAVFWHEALHLKHPDASEREIDRLLESHLQKTGLFHCWQAYLTFTGP